jgi:hypothetical protein
MSSWQIRRKQHERPCELCKTNGILSQRLDPTNWQPHTRRLCRKHRLELGYHPVDWGHGPYHAGKTPGQ